MEFNEQKERILIGEIVSAVGIKGEVKIKSYSSDPNRFAHLSHVEIKDSQGSISRRDIEKARVQGNMPVLKFLHVKDRNSAESLIGAQLYIEESQLEDLPEDTYYIRDLLGLKVLNQREEEVGYISDVLQNGPHDIYVLKLSQGSEAMVPAVKEFIKEVNVPMGYVRIDFIEGMI